MSRPQAPMRPNPPAPSASARQNEYFVPRDGIDREVITADICRYLGNDALVRPGIYENPQNGQVTQGYFINAYRNLTSAMIEDLKADSARWDQERRQQTARNTSGVQYRNSETHYNRQQSGGSADGYPDRGGEYDKYPQNPQNGQAGGNFGGPPPYQGSYGNQQPGFNGGPPPQHGVPQHGGPQPPQPHFTPPNAGGYPGPSASPLGGGALGGPPHGGPQFVQTQDRPYTQVGANHTVREPTPSGYGPSDPYASGQVPTSSMPQGRPQYVTSQAPHQQQGYPPSTSGGFYQQPPASAPGQYAPMQSQDPFMGRTSLGGTPNFNNGHDPHGPPSRRDRDNNERDRLADPRQRNNYNGHSGR